MAYHLITGVTGLLGVYLLRDALRAGLRVAVVVRRSRLATAAERVDDLMLRWDKQAGYALPRPVVFEGDITQPMLGLQPDEVEWIAHNCTAMVHSAASLTFVATPKDGEPHRTNLEGTRNVLELCRTAGIRQFHHVSTAYICGLREGRILESELDVGQQLGNAYEETKLEAERMVRAADFLDSPTFYRPGIITGDSRSGYTTTFHGFYAPLKIAQAMVGRVKYDAGAAPLLLEAIGLTGQEHKNFVPVDWVSAVMTHILTHPEHHARTYHLTPANRTPVADCYRIMRGAVDQAAADRAAAEPASTPFSQADFEQLFHEQMLVYQSYWRDDPEFDTTNTTAAAPHLPCPAVDDAMLLRLAQYALATNFGWPKQMPVKPPLNIGEDLATRWPVTNLAATAADDTELTLGLQVNGAGGGQWTLRLQNDRVAGVTRGISPPVAGLFYLNSTIFRRLQSAELSAEQAIRTGQVFLDGNEAPVGLLAEILTQVVGAVQQTGAETTNTTHAAMRS